MKPITPDCSVFAAALNGDDTQVRDLAGPDGVFCIAAELCSVFLVEVTADGTQQGTLAYPRGITRVELPRSWPVHRIDHDREHFILTSTDGRSVHGTPRQFAAYPKILPAEHNPSYQEHLEEAFLATHLLPPHPPPPGTYASLAEPMLGGHHIDDVVQGTVQVPAAGRDLWVGFDHAGPEKVAELLPHTHRLLAAFDRISRAGTDFLWNRCVDGTESEEERAGLPDAIVPTNLIVYRSADFEVHFQDVSGRYFPDDSYWPCVWYRADMTPVDWCLGA
ncbi:hypothetical protein HS041_36140 [Planomonospora sp. ID67723]|uniref:hypothetical protein n=1 Tax=Planomonospora sp. ID67723 TaxID=2738134 RepID=UPI0018C409FE|nr:hypothetical protein [Planomonospora sp. ID67723]MBG0833137.1 hypothetical protein [Planomonospora sp. ID67723]